MNNGIIWFCLSGLISVLNDVIAKLLGLENFSSTQILFLRLLFSVILLMPFCIKHIGCNLQILLLNIVRAILLYAGMLPWISGAISLPLAITTTISFITPLTSTILSHFLLREYVNFKCIIANIAGFIGIIIMSCDKGFHINTEHLSSIMMLLLSTVCFGLLDILNKKMLIQKDSILSMMFYSAIFTLFISYIFMENINIVSYTTTWNILGLLILLGMGANLILFCLLKAFQVSKVSTLQPLRYIDFITSSLVSWIFFHEHITINIILGACIIIPAALFVVLSKEQV